MLAVSKDVRCPFIVYLKTTAARPDMLTHDNNGPIKAMPLRSYSHWMFQWDNVWRDTLSRPELLFSQTYRAHIVARNFCLDNMSSGSYFA